VSIETIIAIIWKHSTGFDISPLLSLWDDLVLSLGLSKNWPSAERHLILFVLWDFARQRKIPKNLSPIVHNLKDCPKGTYGQKPQKQLLQWRISESDRRGISIGLIG
jgi:hypothetical protein